ncbi:uncharacterized protein Gasu_14480 [Galdieria sulphuraria]|uniref:Uncharacterized protein n=1 Tax=Galdieria sulphuraria TaxID=130081 RepID=M2W607_GALSU|nr:uncharacterized protein Gasu_14480 [Galdieria sulphuraria]EME31201.1 hypothetical protein Gasu_14480 [Galdieria sulphuraria]|eukprot:XP_005707721.1 hypothetical protein Gasu_14480 [Galdieria sulphuraria]
MVVTRRLTRVVNGSNKRVVEIHQKESKKSAKTNSSRERNIRKGAETKRSVAVSVKPLKKSEFVSLPRDKLKELINTLPATVIERLEYRGGVESGQWKVYVSVSDTTPQFRVTQEDSLLTKPRS